MYSNTQILGRRRTSTKAWVLAVASFIAGIIFQTQLDLHRIMASIAHHDGAIQHSSTKRDLPPGPLAASVSHQLRHQHHATLASPVERTKAVSDDKTADRLSENVEKIVVTETKKEIIDFEHQDGVVIAVKVHDSGMLQQLKQSFCLLTAAYNRRVQYDILIFTSIPFPDDAVRELQDIVAPAKLSVVVDTKPLQEELALLTDQQRDKLVKRCHKTNVSELEWDTKCGEEDSHLMDMAIKYNWQAEFRSKHLWTHPALAQYKYMLWFDSDAMCTKAWEHDPIATMIRNNLVLLFDNFPQGLSRGSEIVNRIERSFDRSICGIDLKDGHLTTISKAPCPHGIAQIHGFFHVTNLDFYRSPQVMKWANILVGDDKYSRMFDDQIQVTVPAAMLASRRSWDMASHGFDLQVMHNGRFDGKVKFDRYKEPNYDGNGVWFVPYWNLHADEKFPEAKDVCQPFVTHDG